MPEHLRHGSVVTIPRGNLDNRKAMRLITDLRKSELRNYHRGNQLVRYADDMRTRVYAGDPKRPPRKAKR